VLCNKTFKNCIEIFLRDLGVLLIFDTRLFGIPWQMATGEHGAVGLHAPEHAEGAPRPEAGSATTHLHPTEASPAQGSILQNSISD
jgi:hypothetical protein